MPDHPTTPPPRTARNFPEGTLVSHKEHGAGVVRVDFQGQHYPYFEGTKTTGTPYTRVTKLEAGS